MAADHTSERTRLRFVDEVRTHFGFMEELGFTCVTSEPTSVRFESQEFAVSVYHNQMSHEISLDISRSRESKASSFSEILRLVHGEQASQYRNYSAHTAEQVAKGVSNLAKRWRECVDADVQRQQGGQSLPSLKDRGRN
jgi:hypothetical protein